MEEISRKKSGNKSAGKSLIRHKMTATGLPRGGGEGELDPCLGIGLPLRFQTLILFKTKKIPKIPTLFRTTPLILGPCQGQMTKYALCLGQTHKNIYPV